MAQDKKQSFMKGAAILSASTLLVKLLGLLFSIPLANFIDPEGMSHFYIAYNIFGLFLMLSTAGLPVAVSRMVGTATSQGRLREADRVFSVSFWLFFFLGLFGCLVMFFGANQIAQWYGSPESNFAIMALAPTLFFISIESSIRGYFQGRSNMVPTATSQTIEAVTKVIIGVGLAFYIIQNFEVDRDRWAAVGAIVGVSVSAGLGAIYLLGCKFVQGRRDRRRGLGEEEPLTSRQQTLINLVRFAVPITIGSCFLSLLDTIDGAILMQRLQTGAGFTQDMADWWNGTLGNARKFFDLPGAFVVPISTSLLPVLSGAIASKDHRQVDRISSTALRVTLLIGIPATFVVFHMMFSKLVGKHAARIRSYGEEKMHVLKFFDVRGYLIMAVMMGGGIALRSFHLVPGWFIAFFYTGLGIALALAGVGFLVHYFHRDGYITCPVTGKVREG